MIALLTVQSPAQILIHNTIFVLWSELGSNKNIVSDNSHAGISS